MDYEEENCDGDSGASQYPGSHKPVKGAPGPPVARDREGKWELPGIFYSPTARSKFRALRADLIALAETIETGKRKVSDPVERARLEAMEAVMKLCVPMFTEAFELGRDHETIQPSPRFCPDCPKGKTPLSKNKRFCPDHQRQRRKIQNRLAKRRQREKQNVSNVSN